MPRLAAPADPWASHRLKQQCASCSPPAAEQRTRQQKQERRQHALMAPHTREQAADMLPHAKRLHAERAPGARSTRNFAYSPSPLGGSPEGTEKAAP